jgi:hypothetical protein
MVELDCVYNLVTCDNNRSYEYFQIYITLVWRNPAHTVVSRVSTHGHLNVILARMGDICIEAATLTGA